MSFMERLWVLEVHVETISTEKNLSQLQKANFLGATYIYDQTAAYPKSLGRTR